MPSACLGLATSEAGIRPLELESLTVLSQHVGAGNKIWVRLTM